MNICLSAKNTNKLVNLELTCQLNDNQAFYRNALINYVEEAAIRHLGMLHILKHEGYELANVLLKQTEDIALIKDFFLQYRELEAKSRSLHHAYISGDSDQIKAHLIDFYVLFSPLEGGFTLASEPIKDIKIKAGFLVSFPTLTSTAIINQDCGLGKITEEAIALVHNLDYKSNVITWLPNSFTRSGIRLSTAMTQPSAPGDEFNLIEKAYIDYHNQALATIRFCLDLLTLLNLELGVSMSNLMRLYTVIPSRDSNKRQAGSVSSLLGWAWQDFDPHADILEEQCHLCVQLVHEFFHTKLNLVEKNIPLYTTDGNSPEIFSPWKNRNRPLRQVIHALMTFSAGAAVWTKLIISPWFSSQKIGSQAENYWSETVEFADLAYQGLFNSEVLTDEGKTLISACVEQLKLSVKIGRESLC